MTTPGATCFGTDPQASAVATSGYDPEDIEEAARERLGGGGDPALDDAEQRAYESGEDLLEALDAETLESLVVGDESPDA